MPINLHIYCKKYRIFISGIAGTEDEHHWWGFRTFPTYIHAPEFTGFYRFRFIFGDTQGGYFEPWPYG